MLEEIQIRTSQIKIGKFLKGAFLISWSALLASSIYMFCFFIFVKL